MQLIVLDLSLNLMDIIGLNGEMNMRVKCLMVR